MFRLGFKIVLQSVIIALAAVAVVNIVMGVY